MTQEQAREIFKKRGSKINCKNCPYHHINPQEACTYEQCIEQHFVIGCLIGYDNAIEDLDAAKTLAENRD